MLEYRLGHTVLLSELEEPVLSYAHGSVAYHSRLMNGSFFERLVCYEYVFLIIPCYLLLFSLAYESRMVYGF